jgi:hypothetical protein
VRSTLARTSRSSLLLTGIMESEDSGDRPLLAGLQVRSPHTFVLCSLHRCQAAEAADAKADTNADTNTDTEAKATAETIGFQARARKSRCAAWAARAQAKEDAAAEFKVRGGYPKGGGYQCKCSFEWQVVLALALLVFLSLHACLPGVETRRPGAQLVMRTPATMPFYSTLSCCAILPFNGKMLISNSAMLQPSDLLATRLSGNCCPPFSLPLHTLLRTSC